MKTCVSGAGYVGLSNAELLAQHSQVHVIDIVSAKVYTRDLFGQD
jgi:UDPglucose 6-dehydrogenase